VGDPAPGSGRCLNIKQMYVIMPLTVCPNCVYYRMNDARCISGLNVISKRIAKEGDPKDLPKRGEGLFCHNNLYMAALVVPIIAMIPALILNFSTTQKSACHLNLPQP
jgi:hypothetical protein